MIRRSIFTTLIKRLQEKRKFIQVLLGPRQVGKTTLVRQVIEEFSSPFHFVSADLATLQSNAWLRQQWEVARQIAVKQKICILVIDEVQKIPHWSDVIKALWDEDTHTGAQVKVVLLGSSPWLMQKGLTESLAGRFEIIPVTHWSFGEMQKGFGFSLDEYIYFGGYPGPAEFVQKKEYDRWTNYITDSIIETTISRDILLMSQVNKPALLRRLFQLGCTYSSQLLSYNKMLGQLQDAGNTTTLAHYLDLLGGAGLLIGLQKFAMHSVRQKGSSPKFQVYNTALISAQSNKTFEQARADQEYWGRLVESTIGAYILNSIRGTQIEVFYWREGDSEVDFVLKQGEKITAIEVKSNDGVIRSSGIDLFVKQFNPSKVLLVGQKGVAIEDFLTAPITDFVG